MKKALYDLTSGLVLQWQDWAKYEFSNPISGLAVLDLADDFSFPTEAQWVVAGEIRPLPEKIAAEPSPPLAPKEIYYLRDVYLREAMLRIGPLQDAVDMDEATPKEAAALTAWKRYRIDLNRIDQHPGFPAEVEWPTKPE